MMAWAEIGISGRRETERYVRNPESPKDGRETELQKPLDLRFRVGYVCPRKGMILAVLRTGSDCQFA